MSRGTDLLDFARLLHKWGANVTAIKPGTKRPNHKWQHWQKVRQTLEELERLPWDHAAAVGIVNGSGDFRIFDLDAPKADDGRPLASVPRWVLSTALQSIGLPVDYQWAYISGSGAGFGFVIRCDEDLPGTWSGQSGVYLGLPRAGFDFDHLELRWSTGQTVIMGAHPTGPGYQWLRDQPPFLPPATVSADRVVASFESIAKTPRTRTPVEDTSPVVGRSYGQGALNDAIRQVSSAANGTRNNTLFQQTAGLAELVNGEELSRQEVERSMTAAALAAGLNEREIQTTIASAFKTATASRTAPHSASLLPKITIEIAAVESASPWASIDVFAYPPEDGGIAEAWLAHRGKNWMYVSGLEYWYHWTGTHWEPDSGSYAIRAEIEDLMNHMNKTARAAK